MIEFGGATSRDKTQAVVRATSLEQFAGSGRVEVVKHPTRSRFGMWLQGPLPPDEIVARAKWLVANCPRGRYNLVGYNCEHIANWCVAGGFLESLQVRRWFMAQGLLLGGAILTWRKFRPRPWLAVLLGMLALVAPYVYNLEAFRFWKDIGHRWPGHPTPPTPTK